MDRSEPLDEKEAAIVQVIMGMQHDYDNGLREFQESIHYCIFHMLAHGSKNSTQKEAVSAAIYLRDLANRLHRLEQLLS